MFINYFVIFSAMVTLRKEDVLIAFENREPRRNWLLYNYYRDYFEGDFSRVFIARHISGDLSIDISAAMIRQIIYRVKPKILQAEIRHTTRQPVPPSGNLPTYRLTQPGADSAGKSSIQIRFTNKDDKPEENYFRDLDI
jgi:hypothetical protein